MTPSRDNRNTLPLIAVLVAAAAGACSPSDIVGEGELPVGTSDPEETQTRNGALRAYRGGLIVFRNAVGGWDWPFIWTSGLLSDELQTMGSFGIFAVDERMDRRVLPAYVDGLSEDQITFGYAGYKKSYVLLQSARAKARVGAWLLRSFAPEESPALAAHLDAVEAYADLYLADLYCSGIPLSTVDPGGSTLAPGSTTAEVYQRAMELFDGALQAAGDSARILNFARVGKGRALLALGRHAEAAQAVAAVPDGYEYALQYDASPTGTGGSTARDNAHFGYSLGGHGAGSSDSPGMSDHEGQNGLNWITSGDPRVVPVTTSTDYDGNPRFLPEWLSTEGGGSIVIASWREARLIEAEAALQAGDAAGWLSRLNALRQTGIAPAMADTTDPGTDDARVDLMFRERGFWLFLTGHRQGDLRRLIRQYGRDPSSIYPVGIHPRGGSYGSDVTAPIPAAERENNPLFGGCHDRGA